MPSLSALFSASLALAIAMGVPYATDMLDSFTAIIHALS